uniref:Uncharacterized protein n=1 Tax=Anopheles atroparvus TaxID=41427 RepID=A0AAG5CNN0_ANOAO
IHPQHLSSSQLNPFNLPAAGHLYHVSAQHFDIIPVDFHVPLAVPFLVFAVKNSIHEVSSAPVPAI